MQILTLFMVRRALHLMGCTCNDTEDVEQRDINSIIETDDDTKEELEQRLKSKEQRCSTLP